MTDDEVTNLHEEALVVVTVQVAQGRRGRGPPGGGGGGPGRGGDGDDDGYESREEDDASSIISVMEPTLRGMPRSFSHLSKPLDAIWNPRLRDDPNARQRAMRHLSDLTPNNITRNLYSDPIIGGLEGENRKLYKLIANLSMEVKSMKREQNL